MLSAYIAKTEIWMDNYPSICQIRGYGWTVIRLNSLQGDMGGCCPSTYSCAASFGRLGCNLKFINQDSEFSNCEIVG
jgi:hypothetical protein